MKISGPHKCLIINLVRYVATDQCTYYPGNKLQLYRPSEEWREWGGENEIPAGCDRLRSCRQFVSSYNVNFPAEIDMSNLREKAGSIRRWQ